MAVVQNPLIGRTKQKFSNAVFTTWKGINVLRSKPLTVANPNSPAQQASRAKFALSSKIGRRILEAIKKGFKSQAVGKSEINVFVSKNVNQVDASTVTAPSIPVADLIVSEGQLGDILGATLGTAVGGNGVVDLSVADLANVASGNQVVVVGFGGVDADDNELGNVAVAEYTGSSLSIEVPGGNDTSMEVLIFQYNSLTQESSDAAYFSL